MLFCNICSAVKTIASNMMPSNWQKKTRVYINGYVLFSANHKSLVAQVYRGTVLEKQTPPTDKSLNDTMKTSLFPVCTVY